MSDTQLPSYGEYRVLKERKAPAVLRRELGMDYIYPGMDISLGHDDALSMVLDGEVELIRELDE